MKISLRSVSGVVESNLETHWRNLEAEVELEVCQSEPLRWGVRNQERFKSIGFWGTLEGSGKLRIQHPSDCQMKNPSSKSRSGGCQRVYS